MLNPELTWCASSDSPWPVRALMERHGAAFLQTVPKNTAHSPLGPLPTFVLPSVMAYFNMACMDAGYTQGVIKRD